MENTVKELAARVDELASTVNKWKQWLWVVVTVATVLGGTFGWSLAATWKAVATAQADAEAAQAAASKALSELRLAKEAAATEIQSRGTTMLAGYEEQFAAWVEEHQTTLAPKGIAVVWASRAEPPKGWRLCDGTSENMVNLSEGSILVGSKDTDAKPVDDMLAFSEQKRVLDALSNTVRYTNVFMNAIKVRYICKV